MSESTDIRVARIDTWANENTPARNYAGEPTLKLKDGESYAYLRFTLPRAFKPTRTRSVTVAEAILRVYTKGSWGVTAELSVRRIAEDWARGKLTWNNKPEVTGSSVSETHSSAGDGDVFEIDVTTLMQTVANGADWYGLRIASDTAAFQPLYSSDSPHDDFRPTLEITWTEAPQAPSRLSPSGGRAVSLNKPTVSCNFTDRIGSTRMAAIQVQIDPDNDFSPPAWDSDEVASDEPELDLSTTDYPGLSAGDQTWWRVRVKDHAGLWSEWSDHSTFTRDLKGTLTINNPAASPNNFVSEWTPEFSWSLSGETQKAYQVIVTPDQNRSRHLFDSGRTKGGDTDLVLPKGVIEDDQNYYLIIRIWDDKDREHTPGDPVWTQQDRLFAFNEDPTPDPVDSLSATQIDDGPYVRLGFSRTTAPDAFNVLRSTEGNRFKVVDSGLEPTDLFVGGINYEYIDRDAAPNRTHEYKVQAVVNHESSGNNPTDTVTTNTSGIWIYDRDIDIEVFINGADGVTFSALEQSTWFDPLGATKGVLITQGMQGLQGTITGTLEGGAGRTRQNWVDRMNRIKGRAGRPVRLCLGHDSFPAILNNIAIAPDGEFVGVSNVSFDFRQVGNFDFELRA